MFKARGSMVVSMAKMIAKVVFLIVLTEYSVHADSGPIFATFLHGATCVFMDGGPVSSDVHGVYNTSTTTFANVACPVSFPTASPSLPFDGSLLVGASVTGVQGSLGSTFTCTLFQTDRTGGLFFGTSGGAGPVAIGVRAFSIPETPLVGLLLAVCSLPPQVVGFGHTYLSSVQVRTRHP